MRAEVLACAAKACDTVGAKAAKSQAHSTSQATQGRRVLDRYWEVRTAQSERIKLSACGHRGRLGSPKPVPPVRFVTRGL